MGISGRSHSELTLNKDRMKFALALLALVVVAYAAPQEKRFIESIGHAFESLAHQLQHAVDSATHGWNDLMHSTGLNLDLHALAAKLTPYIDSGMTEATCTSVCVASSASILGPAAPLAGTVCGPLCKFALAQLEQAAGK